MTTVISNYLWLDVFFFTPKIMSRFDVKSCFQSYAWLTWIIWTWKSLIKAGIVGISKTKHGCSTLRTSLWLWILNYNSKWRSNWWFRSMWLISTPPPRWIHKIRSSVVNSPFEATPCRVSTVAVSRTWGVKIVQGPFMCIALKGGRGGSGGGSVGGRNKQIDILCCKKVTVGFSGKTYGDLHPRGVGLFCKV